MSAALERLRALLRDQGGLMATLLGPAAPDGAASSARGARDRAPGAHDGAPGHTAHSPARAAAAGPRTRALGAEYELLVEAIYEGYLLHYGLPRLVRTPEADLRLLAGDRLYAIGLERLVALGDTLAVAELADVIALSALAQGAGEPTLAEAVWQAGAHAVAWGPTDAHAGAKQLVLQGAPSALAAMRTSARERSAAT